MWSSHALVRFCESGPELCSLPRLRQSDNSTAIMFKILSKNYRPLKINFTPLNKIQISFNSLKILSTKLKLNFAPFKSIFSLGQFHLKIFTTNILKYSKKVLKDSQPSQFDFHYKNPSSHSFYSYSFLYKSLLKSCQSYVSNKKFINYTHKKIQQSKITQKAATTKASITFHK